MQTNQTPVASESRQYKDIAGNRCLLLWLVKNEPEWAVNQIQHRDLLEAQLRTTEADAAALRHVLDMALGWDIGDYQLECVEKPSPPEPVPRC